MRKILAVFLLLVVGVLGGVKEDFSFERPPEDYLAITSPSTKPEESIWIADQAHQHEGTLEDMRKYFTKASETARAICSSQSIEDGDSAVMQYMNGKSCIFRMWESLNSLSELANNSDPDSIECSSTDVEHFMDIVSANFGGSDFFNMEPPRIPYKKINMYGYLKSFGKEHYRICLKNLAGKYQQFENNLAHSTELWEQRFDELISLDKPEKNNDKQLTRLARKMDFANGKFEASRMVKAIKYYVNSENRLDSTQTLVRFLDETCAKLRSKKVADIFDVYNLGRALNPDETKTMQFSEKFYKLNEYSRLCTQLIRSKRAASLENIKSNLSNKAIKWVKNIVNTQ